jgi:hypothetical protein
MQEVCSMCGRTADPRSDGDPPIGWCADIVESRDGPRRRWICDVCTRKYVRSIESKLGTEWW